MADIRSKQELLDVMKKAGTDETEVMHAAGGMTLVEIGMLFHDGADEESIMDLAAKVENLVKKEGPTFANGVSGVTAGLVSLLCEAFSDYNTLRQQMKGNNN